MAKTIYSIIHTCADADRGEFPSPCIEGSFLTMAKAQERMRQLIAEENEENRRPLCVGDCRVEIGDDFWEAYEDGYAAACFSRYDIVCSVLEEE